MTAPCAVCNELGRPCSEHTAPAPTPTRQPSTVKLTPAQNALANRLIRGPVPIDDCHAMTLEGLMRRRIATVQNGHAVLIARTRTVGGATPRTVLDLP